METFKTSVWIFIKNVSIEDKGGRVVNVSQLHLFSKFNWAWNIDKLSDLFF